MNNVLNTIKILETPTNIKLDYVIDNLVLKKENITYKWINSNSDKFNLQKNPNIGATIQHEIDNKKFNFLYKKWFQVLCKEADLPTDIEIKCWLKQLQPKSHQVHTDSNNNMERYNTLCRFTIPLTTGPPTCYFDKIMPTDYFYWRKTKHNFIITKKPHETEEIFVTKLHDMETKREIEINDQLPDMSYFSHINPQQLYGLNIHTLGEWKIGYIHFFPFANLHSSTDFDNFTEKWMLNGILYSKVRQECLERRMKRTIIKERKLEKNKLKSLMINNLYGDKR